MKKQLPDFARKRKKPRRCAISERFCRLFRGGFYGLQSEMKCDRMFALIENLVVKPPVLSVLLRPFSRAGLVWPDCSH